MSKVIFNGLGPGRTYRYKGIDYKDGQVVDLDLSNEHIAISSAFAIDATAENITKVRKLLSSASKKREEVRQKFEDLKKAQLGTSDSSEDPATK